MLFRSAEYYRYATSSQPHPTHQRGHELAPAIAALFQAAFTAAAIPSAWATSTVTPIHKKGDPTDTANYRPVAVGVPLARLYAGVLNSRLTAYLEAQRLRAQGQAGFRPLRSVGHNLFALQHAIDKCRRNRQPLYCCFVDLTAAFDRVPRHLLWQRLASRGVSGGMLAAIQSLYADARVVVKVNGSCGPSATTSAGVKQG